MEVFIMARWDGYKHWTSIRVDGEGYKYYYIPNPGGTPVKQGTLEKDVELKITYLVAYDAMKITDANKNKSQYVNKLLLKPTLDNGKKIFTSLDEDADSVVKKQNGMSI
jgi:hypothetical protein